MPEAAPAPASSPALPATPGNFGAFIATAGQLPNNAAAPPSPVATPAQPMPAAPAAEAAPPANDGLNDDQRAFNAQLAAQMMGEELPADAGDPNAPPADPMAEQVHGVAVRDLIEAIKAGGLPDEVVKALRFTVNPNGREIEVDGDELRRGYMRISDYTRGTQQTAELQRTVEQERGKVRAIAEGLLKPETFGPTLEKMGLTSQAQAVVSAKWMQNGQPNPEAFMNDMRRMGQWPAFMAAVMQYGQSYSERKRQLMGGQNTPEAAAYADRLIDHLEAQEGAVWEERLKAERDGEAVRREKWKIEQQQLLAQRQQQNPAIDQRLQTIHQSKIAGQQRRGLAQLAPEAQAAVDQAFVQHYRALEANEHRRTGQMPDPSYIAEQALQAAIERLEDAGWQFPKPNGQAPARQPVTPAPTAMPTRPAAAPVTTSAGQVPNSGTPDDFKKRLNILAGAGMARR